MTPRLTIAPSLSRPRWQTLEPLLDAALALSADLRATFVEQSCGADAGMQRELLAMIKAALPATAEGAH